MNFYQTLISIIEETTVKDYYFHDMSAMLLASKGCCAQPKGGHVQNTLAFKHKIMKVLKNLCQMAETSDV